MNENGFIEIELKLPNHNNELSQAESVIEKLKDTVTKYALVPPLTDRDFKVKFDGIVNVLDYVGNLSRSVFDIKNELERIYTKQYMRAPALAKKLWYEHYETIHKPYTILKNRCFKLLDELDKNYIEIYNEKPPNWKI